MNRTRAFQDGREDVIYPSCQRTLANCPYAEGTTERAEYMAGRESAERDLAAGNIRYMPGDF